MGGACCEGKIGMSVTIAFTSSTPVETSTPLLLTHTHHPYTLFCITITSSTFANITLNTGVGASIRAWIGEEQRLTLPLHSVPAYPMIPRKRRWCVYLTLTFVADILCWNVFILLF